MDRNTVTAVVLIGLITLVWMVWLTPPPPEQPPPGSPEQLTDTTSIVSPDAALPALADQTPAPPVLTLPADSAFAQASTGAERFITVESDFYTARFSTKGATLRAFVLKTYQTFAKDQQVQLIDSSSVGATGLYFTTPSSHNVDTRALYFTTSFSGDVLRVTDSENPVALVFEAQLGDGTLRFVYTFLNESYEVDLQVETEQPSAFLTNDGYELFWDGGLPFAEGNIEDEAQRSGAYGRSGGEVEYVALDSDNYGEQTLRGSVSWVAVKNKYFTAAILPTNETRGAELIGEKLGDVASGTLWEDYEVRLQMPVPEDPDLYRMYLGPLELSRISRYGVSLYDMVDYGWDFFEFMTRPLAKYVFIPFFGFLHLFIPNYGVLIIVFAILIKIVLYPLTKSSFKNMAKMRELQPKMEEIKKKHGDNPQKQQEAMMKMYRETGVNPLGGCLPMLLQYPIIIALWQFLPQAIEIRQQGFLWAKDLSAPDILFHLPFELPLYGDFVAGFTMLMGLSMVWQMKTQMSASVSAPQMKILTYVFPVMIFVIFNRLAAGLNLYYLCYNVLTAGQQKLINRSIENAPKEEPKRNVNQSLAAKKRASKGGSSKGRKGGRR